LPPSCSTNLTLRACPGNGGGADPTAFRRLAGGGNPRRRGRKGLQAQGLVERFVEESELELVPVATEHAWLACEAFRTYGRGRHPAGLNFGDCFAYALAKATREPLLFKGDDFSHTDIATA
jgi:uncharacterized protein with PIN domain